MNKFFYGVIEGFYGRQWTWQVRREYAAFLLRHGFSSYVYAPKGDLYLRSRWRERHPKDEWEYLRALSRHYQKVGVGWGLGLSPLGLGEAYSANDRQLLRDKVKRLNELSPETLCILFDDVRGDIDGLASRQLEVTADILSESCANQHIVCPTYYSFDPVLERVFGLMPEGYLDTLGRGLAESVDVFWTGNKVIAESFTGDDLQAVTELLRRKPVLWDNYPVNDGKLTSSYLHLRAYHGRPSAISEWGNGHMVNPMNQPLLSQLVLQTLPAVYQQGAAYNPARALEVSLSGLGNESLSNQLGEDIALFQDQGLEVMSSEQRLAKSAVYQAFHHPVADEVVGWLKGEYRFDPACLTG